MFIRGDAVPVSEDNAPTGQDPNIIYIKPKMDVRTRNEVIGSGSRVAVQEGVADVNFDVGGYQTALLVNNIVRWEGPAFDGVACTPEAIGSLDPDEPLVEKVLDEIARRNPQKKREKKGR